MTISFLGVQFPIATLHGSSRKKSFRFSDDLSDSTDENDEKLQDFQTVKDAFHCLGALMLML